MSGTFRDRSRLRPISGGITLEIASFNYRVKLVGHFPRSTRLRDTIRDIAMLFGFQPLKDFSQPLEGVRPSFFSPSTSQQRALAKNKAKYSFYSCHAKNPRM